MKKEEYYNKTLKELYECYQKIEKKLSILERRDFLLMIPIVCFAPMPIGSASILMYSLYLAKLLGDGFKFHDKYIDFYFNSVEYQEVYKVYKIVLEELSLFFEKMNWNNEMKIYAGYYYLLKNGYLSVNKSFCYKGDIDVVLGIEGAGIMDGYGNCENISSMLTDLLKQSNYEAYNIEMSLSNDVKISFLNYDFIEGVKEKLGEVINSDDLVDGDLKERLLEIVKNDNHLVTLFKDNILSFGMDPVNNAVFLVNDKIGELVSASDSNCHASYYSINNMVLPKRKVPKLLKVTSDMVMNELCMDYCDVYNSCSDYVDLFEKFYLEHKELYGEIVDKKKVLAKEYSKYRPF